MSLDELLLRAIAVALGVFIGSIALLAVGAVFTAFIPRCGG